MGMRAISALILLSSSDSRASSPVTPDQIHTIIQGVADEKSQAYNCSVSISFKNTDWEVSAAAGVADFGSHLSVTVDDAFAWGSGTKPFTGASVLKLISEGHFSLETPAHTIIDPLLLKSSQRVPTQNFTSMADLWGELNVAGITIGQLLNMTSGIPDFDTAKGHGDMVDLLRLELYSNPTKIYTPQELMAVPWVANQFRPCVDTGPKWHKCYSSTNFMLLGMILANGTACDKFDQLAFAPFALKQNTSLKFGVSGAPADYSPVHGYDRTGYNMPANQTNDQDVAGVDGVFAGWTASDLVGTPRDVAALGWAIYGPEPTILPKEYSDLMAYTALSRDYGLATFNLTKYTGQTGDYGSAIGHIGATYGFQSQLVYFPALKFTLAVATNIETNFQTQAKDALCFAYNKIAGLMLQQDINCTFAARNQSYYSSGCSCTQISPS
jgi:CubicO group peptidase (beta-lactamase class C family)